MSRRLLLATVVLATGCGTGSVDVAFEEPTSTLFADDGDVVETTESTTTLADVPGVADLDLSDLPGPRPDAPGVAVIDGIAAPVIGVADGGLTVATPCDGTRSGSGAPLTVLVALDPAGDAGPEGDPSTIERNHTLAVAVQQRLADAGVSSMVTRGPDDDLAASYRAAAAEASGARVVVSLAIADGEAELTDEPGLEIVHPAADADGRRLAGLVHASLRPVVDFLSVGWPADVEPGVRAVLNQRGTDFFGMLREPSGAARIVVHLPVDPAAPTLLAPTGSEAFADAIADAVARHLVTDDEGDGFVATGDAIRNAPTASSTEACLDPLAVDVESAEADG